MNWNEDTPITFCIWHIFDLELFAYIFIQSDQSNCRKVVSNLVLRSNKCTNGERYIYLIRNVKLYIESCFVYYFGGFNPENNFSNVDFFVL